MPIYEVMKNIRNIIRETIRGKLMAKSWNGEVYEVPGGKILKITKDSSEYKNALEFIKRPSPYFVKYYSAKELPSKQDGTPQYELVMDKLKELNDQEWSRVDMVTQTLGRQDYMLDDQKRYAFLGELKRNPEWYEDFATYKEMVQTTEQLRRMYKEADRREITLHDLRAQNIGTDTKGALIHFDIGAG